MVLDRISDAEIAEARDYVRKHGRQYRSGFGGVCAVCHKPVAAASVEIVQVDPETRKPVKPVGWGHPDFEKYEHVIVGRNCKKAIRY